MSSYDATILITTKNRRGELRRALISAVAQTGAKIEILVIDDGSTDDTADLVRKEFPTARLERREESRGLIVRRNEGARLAAAPIVISLDDDAEFSNPGIVSATLADFNHPRIGAVAIPFVNVLQGMKVLQRAPDGGDGDIFITDTYIGTAHALQRDLFLSLDGYREHLFHQGEEGDYCLRMLGEGYVVRLGRTAPIHHYESAIRSTERMDFYGRRNDVLFVWHNVPMPYFPGHLAATIFNGLRYAITLAKNPGKMVSGLLTGCADSLRYSGKREPVPSPIYRLHRHLKKSGSLRLAEIETDLPPMHGTDY